MKCYSILLLALLISHNFTAHSQIYVRNDTLIIPEITTPPEIDGNINSQEWELPEWHFIDQIWMPYNNEPINLEQANGLELWKDTLDFKGKYKISWSSSTNRLYFLVVTTDDVFTGGYVYNENSSLGGDYPNYDIVEVFIDEDRSGGLHVFDGTGSTGLQWGTNAENAFSYHIAADPQEESTQYTFNALDIAGTNWGYPNQKIANYTSHFDEFAVKKSGTNYVWEFSLIVHNDSYDKDTPENSIVALYEGKVMGLSMAYCDNDNPEETPLKRDHFFGSVFVPEEAYNDHWMQADWFGVAKLSGSHISEALQITKNKQIDFNCYFVNRMLNCNLNSPFIGQVNLQILNLVGTPVYTYNETKYAREWNHTVSTENIPQGIYVAEIIHNNFKTTKKIFIR